MTEKNSTRNVIRTAAFNKLRMEDKRGEEHIKLSTEYGGKTQLNLGHSVDAARELRGKGLSYVQINGWRYAVVPECLLPQTASLLPGGNAVNA